jgi:DNA-directed RNA polymerase subunit K/omega
MQEKILLTKYECSSIIGVRSGQLSMSAPVQVTNIPKRLEHNLMYIATIELIEKKLDMFIKRPLPHNRFYQVHLKDTEIPEDVFCLKEMIESS